MERWVRKIRRLSLNQLRALKVLVESKNGMVESEKTEKEMGLKGKAVGGVFSSLSRQQIDGEYLIEAWGRSMVNRGLRWKLNEKIDKKKLKKVIEEVLRYE